MRKLEPIDKNDRPLEIPNPVPKGFIITENAMQEIRERAMPDGVAMVCQVTFIREATDEMPEPEWTVTILRGRFEEKEFPEIAGVRFLFPDCTLDELAGRTLDFTEKGGFQLLPDRAQMEVMPNDKTSLLTAAETSQIIKALTAGAGKPPTERESAIALKWAGLTAISSTFLSGVLRGDLTMNIRGDEPAFDITAKGIAVLQRRSNNASETQDHNNLGKQPHTKEKKP